MRPELALLPLLIVIAAAIFMLGQQTAIQHTENRWRDYMICVESAPTLACENIYDSPEADY